MTTSAELWNLIVDSSLSLDQREQLDAYGNRLINDAGFTDAQSASINGCISNLAGFPVVPSD